MKLKKLLSLVILFVLFISEIPIVAVNASDPFTIGVHPVGSIGQAFDTPYQYGFANGLFWVFYMRASDTHLVFRTSPDGVTFSPEMDFASNPFGSLPGFSIWISPSGIVYYVRSWQGVNSFRYRWGTLNADGTISWSIAETTKSITSSPNFGGYPEILQDNSGRVFVLVNTKPSADAFQIWRLVGTVWTRIDPSYTGDGRMFLLANGGLGVVFDGNPVYGMAYISTSDGGATWSSPVGTSDAGYTGILTGTQIVTIGNKVYVPMGNTGAKTVAMWTISDGDLAWAGPTTIATLSFSLETIGAATDGNFLITIWFASGVDGVYEFYSSDNGATWSSPLLVSGLGSQSLSSGQSTYANQPTALFLGYSSTVIYLAILPSNIYTVIIPCNYFQLQCWWYPALFFSLYLGLVLVVATRADVEGPGRTYLALAALNEASMAQTAMGLLNPAVPLLLITLTVVYAVRFRNR